LRNSTMRAMAAKLLERFGGRLRLCISGGAALNPQIAHTFIGLGLPICQGYGLTEASPVLSVNLLEKNDPASIGVPLPGVEVAFGENSVLRVRGPMVMMGYWRNPEATAKVLDADGWLDTGDQARLKDGFLYITGRIKEIIVLGNGEKVPPVDMELAAQLDPLFEQVMIVGEGRPYLAALVVLNAKQGEKAGKLDARNAHGGATARVPRLCPGAPHRRLARALDHRQRPAHRHPQAATRRDHEALRHGNRGVVQGAQVGRRIVTCVTFFALAHRIEWARV
jgi:long-chain acyl-CoA synthetase